MTDHGPEGGTATQAPPAPPPPGSTTAVGYDGPTPPRRPRRSGVTTGVILVLVGVVLLAAQLLPGIGLFNMWPLIIIVVGLVQAFTPDREGYWSVERFFDGFVTVAFGLVFLAITMGYIGWNVFVTILSLWPVLLISAGLGIIGKAAHQNWIKALGSIVVILALGYAVAISYTGSTGSWMWSSSGGKAFSLAEPVGSTDSARLDLNFGMADVNLDSGSDLIEAKGESPFGEPTLAVDRSGSSADVRFDLGGKDSGFVFPGAVGASADVKLASDVVWDASISAGASTLDADLSDLSMRRFELKPGVANCSVRLGEVPDGVDEAVAEVKAGVSTVSLEVPSDAEVRIESDSGLVGFDIDPRFRRAGDGWESPGYSAARSSGNGVWVVRVKSGVGTFSLDTY